MMKKIVRLLFFGFVLCVVSCKPKSETTTRLHDFPAVRQSLLQENKLLELQIQAFLEKVMAGLISDKELLADFHQLRNTYKKMEWAVEYFLPATARFINGPALPEIEFEESVVLPPEGLQLLEELFYAEGEKDRNEIIRQLRVLNSKTINISTQFETITINKAQMFDALRLSAFGLASLGLAGFDTPVAGTHLGEAVVTLRSIIR